MLKIPSPNIKCLNISSRINKMNSVKDCEQKKSGNYFFIDDHDSGARLTAAERK
jgi:hypothetical protein